MRPIDNYEAIKPNYGGGGRKEVPGGYIVKITFAEDVPQKEYLRIEWDYTDGDLAGAHKEFYENVGFWPSVHYCSYKQRFVGMFKAFIEAVAKSNEGFVWNWNERDLVGKWVGVVTREKEYLATNGEVKTKIIIDKALPAVDILNGNFTVQPIIKHKEEPARSDAVVDMTATVIPDSEIPF